MLNIANMKPAKVVKPRLPKRVVAPLSMWAVIVRSQRTEWIHWQTIARTRREAWDKYKEGWLPEHQQQCESELRSGMVRLSRVIVVESITKAVRGEKD